jgi:hypothetical protein
MQTDWTLVGVLLASILALASTCEHDDQLHAMKIRTLQLAAVAAFIALGQSLIAVPALINGSLTGPIANGGVPTGWSILAGSPDTMDENNNVGGNTPFGVTPSGPSLDGGTWIGFANGSGNFAEIFGQMVSGFTVGATYDLRWYEGNFGALTGPSYLAANSIAVTVGGSYVGSGSLLSLSPNWSSDSLTFVAGAPNLQINFGLTIPNVDSYLSIDGISLREVGTQVPDQGGTAMLLCFGFGLIALLGTTKKLQPV